MSERERRNLGEDECDGRELHDVCKGPSKLSRHVVVYAERKSQAGTCWRQLSPPSFVRLPMAGAGMRDRQGANPTEPWKGVFVKHRNGKRSA